MVPFAAAYPELVIPRDAQPEYPLQSRVVASAGAEVATSPTAVVAVVLAARQVTIARKRRNEGRRGTLGV
jgi:hypothetical protein